MAGELDPHYPKCLGVLRASCAPVAAFLSWRKRDLLRFPMLTSDSGGNGEGFLTWAGIKREAALQIAPTSYSSCFIGHPYRLPLIIWKMYFIQLYKV